MIKNIKFNSFKDAKNFIEKTVKCPFDVDLISGRYLIDAKSIMGVFSLDLDEKMKIDIHSDDCDEYLKEISEYLLD